MLKEEPGPEPTRIDDYDGSRGAPGLERRFLGSEWNVDVWFGSPATFITTAAEIPSLAIATLAEEPRFADPALCIVMDPERRRLMVIPCWEIFRVFYSSAPIVARLTFQFPGWGAAVLDLLVRTFHGHDFRGHSISKRATDEEFRPSNESRDYAAARLEAIGRDAAVSYATTGRAQIRAIPPFCGPATLRCVAVPCAVPGYSALFVQQIVSSQAAPNIAPGIAWSADPVRPRFRSSGEVDAWWATYRCGFVPGVGVPDQTWPEFVTAVNERAEAEALRRHGPQWLTEALGRTFTPSAHLAAPGPQPKASS